MCEHVRVRVNVCVCERVRERVNVMNVCVCANCVNVCVYECVNV